jgi:membrane associated rhomboid family serine protease
MIVTKALIAINVLVFLAGMVMQFADGVSSGVVTGGSGDLNFDGGLIVSAATQTGELIGVADGEWWRLLTSGFLHGGLLHLGLNMYFIWMFGQLLEPSLHRVRFALVYFAALFGGSIGAMLYSAPNTFTVGASGAAFGLLGAAIAIARIRKIQALESSLLTLAAINFGIGFIPGFNVSVGGHLGGFIVGALCGWLIAGPLNRQRALVTGLLAVLVVALFAGGIAVADMRSLFPN